MKRVTIQRIAAVVLVVSAVAIASGQNAVKRMKPVLLVIDVQNEYLKMVPDRDRETASMYINYAIGMFREKGFPVVRVYNTDPAYGPKPGTDAFEFPASFQIRSDDPKVVKNFPSAFKKTDLDRILREKGRNTVFLCGLSAVGCVMATYFGAMDLDYEAFLFKDTLMSHDSDYTNSIEDMFNAVGYQAVKAMLENAEK